MDEIALQTTRRSLHGIAELILAGPQYRRTHNMRLRATPGGFGTVLEPDLRVDGLDLVTPAGRLGLTGTYGELAAAAGVEATTMLRDVYHEGSDVTPDETIELDASIARQLADAWAAGDAALRMLAPDETPVLWPEHFDISITVAEVNYGVSPGDGFQPEPYAYVGPWTVPAGDGFWNAPFGAARPIRELAGADAVLVFFQEGRRLATQ